MEILNQSIELCCYICALHFLSGIKLTNRIWKYGISFLIIVIIGTWFEKSGIENATPIWMLVQLISLYGFISEAKKKILFSITAFAIIGFFNVFVALGLSMLNINIVDIYYSWCICLVILLIISIWVKISKKSLIYPKISISIYILVILMVLLMAGLLMCDITYQQNIGKRGGIITTVIVIAIVIIIVIMMIILFVSETSLEWHKEQASLMKKYLEMQEKYYISVYDSYHKLRRFEHDTKKHFNFIRFMMEEKNYDEIKDYVDQLSDQLYSATGESYSCSNHTISAILNQMKSRIDAENIQFEFNYEIFNLIEIKSVDLSTLLYNLMQNAIEACEKIEREKRKILLGFYGCESTLIIKIGNSVGQKVDEQKVRKFQTSKKDSTKHGFGLINVEAVVKKYNGCIEYKCEEKSFCVVILLFDVIKSTD